jgi:hypothetical protein
MLTLILAAAIQHVALVQDFTGDPKGDLFTPPADEAKAPYYIALKKTLQESEFHIFCTDLKKEEKELSKIVFWNIPRWVKEKRLKTLPKNKSILFLWEPPTTAPDLYTKKAWEPFKAIYTWDDDLVDGKRFFKFHYPVLAQMDSDLVPFPKRQLCTTICTNKKSSDKRELYSERERAITFFDAHAKEFAFYGFGWEKTSLKSYKGTVDDKHGTLKKYKFALCYENMGNIKGYITEKIFDCFRAGTVPIYLGASNIETYIPKSCFIDRRAFASDAALLAHIQSITEEEHATLLANIRTYLASPAAQKFSSTHFIATLLKSLNDE